MLGSASNVGTTFGFGYYPGGNVKHSNSEINHKRALCSKNHYKGMYLNYVDKHKMSMNVNQWCECVSQMSKLTKKIKFLPIFFTI